MSSPTGSKSFNIDKTDKNSLKMKTITKLRLFMSNTEIT